MRYKLRNSERDRAYYERRKLEEDEQLAHEIINESLKKHNLTREDLVNMKKSDERKVKIALEIRKITCMSADWIGEHLHMGTRGGISNAIREYCKDSNSTSKKSRSE